MKNAARWLFSVTSICGLFWFMPTVSYADNLLRFEVTGELWLLEQFDAAWDKQDPGNKACPKYYQSVDILEEKGVSGGLVIYCQDLPKYMNAFYGVFASVTTSSDSLKLADVTRPLQVAMASVSSATLADCGGDCSVGCKCGYVPPDNGVCAPRLVGGTTFCLHRTHGCIKR